MNLSPHPQPNPKAEYEYVDPPQAVFRAFNPWKATLQECLVARYSIDNKEDPFSGTLNFGWWKTTITFLTDWLPRRIFINLLLHIPSIYISRFEAAINKEGLSLVDMKQLAHEELITRIRRESPLFKIEFRTGCLFGGYHVRDLG